MIFTSYTYVIFLILAFFLYWTLPNGYRKPLLIVFSYTFYCYWRWEFGLLLLGSTLFNWFYAKYLFSKKPPGKMLALGIMINLLPLLYFKYTGFFLSNIGSIFRFLGHGFNPIMLNIILPLGISFSTFQSIAYLVDVSAGEKPFIKLQDFFLFKTFWPQLLAGPIIRPAEIKAQIESKPHLNYDDFSYGLRRILLGFFKKVIFADTLAPYVDMVFISNLAPGAIDILAGVLAFGLQIYFDFSAYSDIAIGSARLFGFIFPENFDIPYISSSPQEFWNRWHKTLSRCIKDYIFTPLAFKTRRHPVLTNLWLVIAMAICGLWHGAQWTFVLWGVWHGVLLVANQTIFKGFFSGLTDNIRARLSLRGLLATALTFTMVTAGWLLFRAKDLAQVFDLGKSLVTFKGGFRPLLLRENALLIISTIFVGLIFVYILRAFRHNLKGKRNLLFWQLSAKIIRPVMYALAIIAIIIFDKQAKAFVYFQF
jgi:D-alanyl-lipoteichoic acid acyltransferase DltB (MBOAT superfamily)